MADTTTARGWLYTWDDDRPAPSTTTPIVNADEAQPLLFRGRGPIERHDLYECMHCGGSTKRVQRECFRVACMSMRNVDMKAQRAHAQAARVMR